MDVHRAQEIVDSTDQFEVLYNNESVWIENVNKQEKEAMVRIGNHSELVPISDLVEVRRKM